MLKVENGRRVETTEGRRRWKTWEALGHKTKQRRTGRAGDKVQMGKEGNAEQQSTGQAGFLETQPAQMEVMPDHMQLH